MTPHESGSRSCFERASKAALWSRKTICMIIMVSLEVAPKRGHLKEQWREAGVAFLGRRSELACLSLLFHICVTSTSSIFSVHSHWKEEIIIKDPTSLCVLSPHVTGFVICNISYPGSWTVWVVGGCEFLEMPSVSLTSTDFSFQVLTLLSLKERLLASWAKHFSVQSSALVGTLKVAFEKIRFKEQPPLDGAIAGWAARWELLQTRNTAALGVDWGQWGGYIFIKSLAKYFPSFLKRLMGISSV